MELFTLLGKLKMDDAEVGKLDGIKSKAEMVSGKLGAVGKSAAVMGGVIAAGVGVAAGALFKVAENAAGAGDRVDKLSQKIGLSRQNFQEWDYILGQNGIEVEKLQTGIKTMTDAMGGVGDGAKAFEKLGISLKDSTGKMRSQEDVFAEAVKKLQGIEDQTLKASMATDLFGRAGTELMPLLNQTAESTEELKKHYKELGIAMSDEAVDSAVLFSDTLDDLKKAFGAVVTQVGVEVMPLFQKLLEWVLNHMPQIKQTTKAAFDIISKAVGIAWDLFENFLLPVFSEIYSWVERNWPTIEATIKGVFDAIKWTWDNVLAPVFSVLMDVFGAIFGWVEDNFPAIQKTIESVFGVIADVVGGVVKIFETLTDGIGKALDAWKKWRDRPEDEKEKTAYGGASVGGTANLRKYIDGSNANGLDYVPFDGYISELHKGERVLTADEAREQDRYGVYRMEKQELVISGKLVIEGVTDDGVFVKAAEYALDKLETQLRREARGK